MKLPFPFGSGDRSKVPRSVYLRIAVPAELHSRGMEALSTIAAIVAGLLIVPLGLGLVSALAGAIVERDLLGGLLGVIVTGPGFALSYLTLTSPLRKNLFNEFFVYLGDTMYAGIWFLLSMVTTGFFVWHMLLRGGASHPSDLWLVAFPAGYLAFAGICTLGSLALTRHTLRCMQVCRDQYLAALPEVDDIEREGVSPH